MYHVTRFALLLSTFVPRVRLPTQLSLLRASSQDRRRDPNASETLAADPHVDPLCGQRLHAVGGKLAQFPDGPLPNQNLVKVG